MEEIIEIIKLIVQVLSIITSSALIGITVHSVHKGDNNTHIGDINNYNREELPIEQKLIVAQKNYLAGQYLEAYDIYIECYEQDAKACLNLGYLYSKGLGCTRNFFKACEYYKKSYEDGLKQGLMNYLALNLITPNSLEETMLALKYGYEEENKEGYKEENKIATKYISYLQTGIMYEFYNKECLNNAKLFLNNNIDKQILILKEKLVLSNVEVQKMNNETVPKDTEFRKYSKYTNEWKNTRHKNYKST